MKLDGFLKTSEDMTGWTLSDLIAVVKNDLEGRLTQLPKGSPPTDAIVISKLVQTFEIMETWLDIPSENKP